MWPAEEARWHEVRYWSTICQGECCLWSLIAPDCTAAKQARAYQIRLVNHFLYFQPPPPRYSSSIFFHLRLISPRYFWSLPPLAAWSLSADAGHSVLRAHSMVAPTSPPPPRYIYKRVKHDTHRQPSNGSLCKNTGTVLSQLQCARTSKAVKNL